MRKSPKIKKIASFTPSPKSIFSSLFLKHIFSTYLLPVIQLKQRTNREHHGEHNILLQRIMLQILNLIPSRHQAPQNIQRLPHVHTLKHQHLREELSGNEHVGVHPDALERGVDGVVELGGHFA